MRLGLVLGAGGIAGEAFHRGVLRALEEAGVDARQAEVVVGTSAGSVVAASLRARGGPSGPATLPPDLLPRSRFARSRVGERLGDGRLLGGRPGARLAGRLPAGRISTEHITASFRRRYGDGWPQRETWVVAVRRRDGRRVVFGRAGAPATDVASAVAASCAIPGWFAPVTIGGVQYVDGGAHSPTNADLLADRRLDLVVVSSPMSMEPRALRAGVDVPLRLNAHRYLVQETFRLRRSAGTVIALEPARELAATMGLTMMDGRSSDRIEELAYERARQRLRDARVGQLSATS